MNDLSVKIENLSKQYRLGKTGTGTLAHDLNRFWHKIQGKQDPYLKIGVENNREIAGGDYVWALQDINLTLKKGDVLGLIGGNGAGKSTLLKILSNITSPTKGKICLNGRLASLLEVGTGFHPELTGRENIFLNGAILGMKKWEINNKLDAIIDFSGCGKYIDTPVKRYSSGMRVRLGFAVAAFLESEILIVDEVLAVGDAEFQRKAIGKMQDVSNMVGKTVIFVSHSMSSIRKLCNRGAFIEKGLLKYDGTVEDAITHYLNQSNKLISETGIYNENEESSCELQLIKVTLLDNKKNPSSIFLNTDKITVKIDYRVKSEIVGMRFNLKVCDQNETVIFTSSSYNHEPKIKTKGLYSTYAELPVNFFNHNRYVLQLQSGIPGVKQLFKIKNILTFDIELGSDTGSRIDNVLPGLTSPNINWYIE